MQKSNYKDIPKVRCEACFHDGSFYPLDYEHVLTRKARPDLENDPRNVMVVCRKCHQEKGSKGISHMANKYPSYHRWLLVNGWEFCELYKKWRLYE